MSNPEKVTFYSDKETILNGWVLTVKNVPTLAKRRLAFFEAGIIRILQTGIQADGLDSLVTKLSELTNTKEIFVKNFIQRLRDVNCLIGKASNGRIVPASKFDALALQGAKVQKFGLSKDFRPFEDEFGAMSANVEQGTDDLKIAYFPKASLFLSFKRVVEDEKVEFDVKNDELDADSLSLASQAINLQHGKVESLFAESTQNQLQDPDFFSSSLPENSIVGSRCSLAIELSMECLFDYQSQTTQVVGVDEMSIPPSFGAVEHDVLLNIFTESHPNFSGEIPNFVQAGALLEKRKNDVKELETQGETYVVNVSRIASITEGIQNYRVPVQEFVTQKTEELRTGKKLKTRTIEKTLGEKFDDALKMIGQEPAQESSSQNEPIQENVLVDEEDAHKAIDQTAGIMTEIQKAPDPKDKIKAYESESSKLTSTNKVIRQSLSHLRAFHAKECATYCPIPYDRKVSDLVTRDFSEYPAIETTIVNLAMAMAVCFADITDRAVEKLPQDMDQLRTGENLVQSILDVVLGKKTDRLSDYFRAGIDAALLRADFMKANNRSFGNYSIGSADFDKVKLLNRLLGDIHHITDDSKGNFAQMTKEQVSSFLKLDEESQNATVFAFGQFLLGVDLDRKQWAKVEKRMTLGQLATK